MRLVRLNSHKVSRGYWSKIPPPQPPELCWGKKWPTPTHDQIMRGLLTSVVKTYKVTEHTQDTDVLFVSHNVKDFSLFSTSRKTPVACRKFLFCVFLYLLVTEWTLWAACDLSEDPHNTQCPFYKNLSDLSENWVLSFLFILYWKKNHVQMGQNAVNKALISQSFMALRLR